MVGGNSIGNDLSALVSAQVQALRSSGAGRSGATDEGTAAHGSSPFDDLLAQRIAAVDPSGRARAQATPTAAGSEDVDQIWKRAQSLDLARGTGPGDAMMRQFDARDASKRDGSSEPFAW